MDLVYAGQGLNSVADRGGETAVPTGVQAFALRARVLRMDLEQTWARGVGCEFAQVNQLRQRSGRRLLHDMGSMNLDGLDRNAHRISYLLVESAIDDLLQYLALSSRKGSKTGLEPL